MSLRKYANKRDANEKAIIKALTGVGASVVAISMSGVSDLLCGFRGQNFLLEIKSARGKLTSDQLEFIDEWRGQYAVVYTIEEALQAIGAVE